MSFAEELLAASSDDSLSRAELRALLRLASMQLQRAEIEIERAYLDMINELLLTVGKPPVDVNDVLKDYLIEYGETSAACLTEDSETEGSA